MVKKKKRELISVKPWTLGKLINFVKQNNVRIPEFQRGYVWEKKDIEALFRSLINGYPIGTILFWKTKRPLDAEDARDLFGIPRYHGKDTYYVLDGQQRLLTLFYLMEQDTFSKVHSLFEEFSDKDIDFTKFSINRRKNTLEYAKKGIKFDKAFFLKKLNEKGYVIPIEMLNLDNLGGEKYATAEKIFEELNERGKHLSTEALFLARVWSKRTNLGKKLREWMQGHKGSLCGDLDRIVLIHSFAVIMQLEHPREFDIDSVDISWSKLKEIAEMVEEDKSHIEIFKKVLKAVELTMSYLSDNFCINRISALPSQTMVTVLSVFFYYKKDPGPTQIREINKWFWKSSLTSRYAGRGYKEHVKEDLPKMIRLTAKRITVQSRSLSHIELADEKELSKRIEETSISGGKSSVRNAIKLMLWMCEPTWITGAKINPVEKESEGKKKQDDHFYPKRICYKDKIIGKNEINNILNIQFLPQGMNIGPKKGAMPSIWLSKVKKTQRERFEDEYFDSNLLPFDSITQLVHKENKFLDKKGKIIRRRVFLRHYEDFIDDRLQLFQDRLMHLQKKGCL